MQPSDLHFSMLLLGAKGAGITTPAPDDAPPTQINKEYLKRAPKLKGDNIQISVKWKAGDAEKTRSGRGLAHQYRHQESRSARTVDLHGIDVSRTVIFWRNSEGAFAALVTYPAALINNPRKGSDDDLVWEVNAKAVPPVETPVEITIKLEPTPEAKPSDSK